MRLLTWNINHKAAMKDIPSGLVPAIGALAPDVAVLTEYVHGPSRGQFLCDLKSIGLRHFRLSPYTQGQNRVLIAASFPLRKGRIRAPKDIDVSVSSNVLHVCADDIEILGLRIPDFSRTPLLRCKCWDWILKTADADEVKDRPFVILGDFNTDPSYPQTRCGDRLEKLVDKRWQHAPSEATFWNLNGHAVRIDHVFVSRHFVIGGSRSVRPCALSDHAALWVDIIPKEEIKRLAYYYWQARGCPIGSPEEDWYRAEKELRQLRIPYA